MQHKKTAHLKLLPAITFPSFRSYLTVFLLVCFVFSISSVKPPTELGNLLGVTRDFPTIPQTHESLATFYLTHQMNESAQTELQLTKELLTQVQSDQRVLGLITQLDATRIALQEKPVELQTKQSYWQNVVDQYPYYRDGWVQLMYLGKQTQNQRLTTEAIVKLTELDPLFVDTLLKQLPQ